jgi:hypothetical protein
MFLSKRRGFISWNGEALFFDQTTSFDHQQTAMIS